MNQARDGCSVAGLVRSAGSHRRTARNHPVVTAPRPDPYSPDSFTAATTAAATVLARSLWNTLGTM